MSLKIGNRVSELTFLQADGSTLSLSDLVGRPLLVIFLRHLA